MYIFFWTQIILTRKKTFFAFMEWTETGTPSERKHPLRMKGFFYVLPKSRKSRQPLIGCLIAETEFRVISRKIAQNL